MPAVQVFPAFEKLEDVHPRPSLGPEPPAVEQITLQGREEALTQGVVLAVAGRAHRRSHPGLATALAEGDLDVLRTLIGVVDHRLRPELLQRCVQCGWHQFGPQRLFAEDQSAAFPLEASTSNASRRGSTLSTRPGQLNRRLTEQVMAMRPGRVMALLAKEGADVRSGQGIVVLRSMNMKDEILADRDGVRRLFVAKGKSVESGEPLF